MQRIVITGATGEVGMALLALCIKQNIEVYVISHADSERNAQIPVDNPLVHLVLVELSELSKCREQIVNTCDVFYHMAWMGTTGEARNNVYLQNQNVQYTLDAVELAVALGCHTFIGIGSQAEYGRVNGILTPDIPCRPENGYGMAKLCAGQMSRILCRQHDICHVWPRILSVYGQYDGINSMVMSTLQKIYTGQKTFFTLGEQQWDYLYAKDAARALFLLGTSGKDGAVYCIGSGKVKPLKEYIKIIYETMVSHISCQNLQVLTEEQMGIGKLPYGEQQVMHLQADITSLHNDTGFEPDYDFKTGIQETIEWFLVQQDRQNLNKR